MTPPFARSEIPGDIPGGIPTMEVQKREVTRVKLLSDLAAVAPGTKFKLGIVIEHAPHKHTYWSNPGDTGVPTEITWEKTSGITLGKPGHPAPKLLKQDTILSFVNEGRTVLIVDAIAPSNAKPGETLALTGKVSWLECDENSCLPGEASVSLDIAVEATGRIGAQAASIREAEALLSPGERVQATLARGDAKTPAAITLPPESVIGRDFSRAVIFPIGYEKESSDAALHRFALSTPEKLKDGSLRFTYPDSGAVLKPGAVDAVVNFGSGHPLLIRAAGASAGAKAEADTTFALALLLAFGGGIILNVMPCVFPVLGLKIYGFVNKAGGNSPTALRHGLSFAAGIVVSFWMLAGALIAVRGFAAGWLGVEQGELGWGFLQQMPGFNVVIATLFLVMALGMCGVFEFGTGVQNAAGGVRERDGFLGSFLSGALATLVATPCSGPGMAPAISFALGATPLESFAVFTALALGLATPFVIFSSSPKLLSLLPRPGAWMESFKQGMSFLLFGSFAYFVWVLSAQLEEQSMLLTLFAFTLIAFAAWIYGRWATPEREPKTRLRATVIAAMLGLGALGFIFTRLPEAPSPGNGGEKTAAGIGWTHWSPEAQSAALASGKPVYIDFTARWCLTCQANKYVYQDPAVIKAFADRQIVALKADWSNRDKRVAAELARYGKATIPFNIVLNPNGKSTPLPPVLTPGIVTTAIAEQ